MKITAQDRAEWNARPQTRIFQGIIENKIYWIASEGCEDHQANTKSAAINAAIRAERKGKGKR